MKEKISTINVPLIQYKCVRLFFMQFMQVFRGSYDNFLTLELGAKKVAAP